MPMQVRGHADKGLLYLVNPATLCFLYLSLLGVLAVPANNGTFLFI